MDETCIVVLVVSITTTNGTPFHPTVEMLFISGKYLVVLDNHFSSKNLSLQYMSWMMNLGLG